jgi:hypothetical protein
MGIRKISCGIAFDGASRTTIDSGSSMPGTPSDVPRMSSMSGSCRALFHCTAGASCVTTVA